MELAQGLGRVGLAGGAACGCVKWQGVQCGNCRGRALLPAHRGVNKGCVPLRALSQPWG